MAKPTITLKDIEKIAELASLELTAEEKQRFVGQFEELLGYFNRIDAAPIESLTEVQAHPVDSASHLREDVAESSGVSPEAFSAHLENGHFKVPKVIE
ncbi:MAG: Asp-tRNA(Asn)/Glu-tRNA(Gln) amidotransferase subunit GatC [Deltaproteobacteria bacterium]|nr:Asp-tRNA(Asn)/Glu-tRNA(Gln) amidotransferase subunit GatC [Deltaproteobacteria bacterium]